MRIVLESETRDVYKTATVPFGSGNSLSHDYLCSDHTMIRSAIYIPLLKIYLYTYIWQSKEGHHEAARSLVGAENLAQSERERGTDRFS